MGFTKIEARLIYIAEHNSVQPREKIKTTEQNESESLNTVYPAVPSRRLGICSVWLTKPCNQNGVK